MVAPLQPPSHISTLKLHLRPRPSFPHHPLIPDGLTSVPGHKTEIFEAWGVFSSFFGPLQGLAPSRSSGNAYTRWDRWIWSSGGGVSSNLCPAPTTILDLQPEEPQGSRNFPASPAGNQRAATCAPPPSRNPGGAGPPRPLLLLLLPPVPTAHSHLGFGRIKAQSLFQPPSQPNWQLLACCLCPDMAEGHWQLGDGVDFPFGSGEEGEGRGSPPP